MARRKKSSAAADPEQAPPKLVLGSNPGPVATLRQADHPYRVFISFSHKDAVAAQQVARHFHSLGLVERYTATLAPGGRFREQIKDDIARAHLFVPILTRSAATRTWVHQEIGYAIGMNVPLLPLAIGELPAGLADELQALRVLPDLSNLAAELTLPRIEYCVHLASAGSSAVFEHAEYPEDRTRMLVSAAQQVVQYGQCSLIRQIGRFGSFSLPSDNPRASIWDTCEIPERPHSHALRRDLCKERQVLEQHARTAGCKLILMPQAGRKIRSSTVAKTRMELLLEFLKSMPDDKVDVVITDAINHGNLLLIGDWFLAESITPSDGLGFLQTLGTWHAPTVLHRMREFDEELGRLLAASVKNREPSRKVAMRSLEKLIAEEQSR